MMRIAIPACLFFAALPVVGQTAPAKPRTVVHHTATAKPASTAAGSADANAPGIPKTTMVPKTLYALKYVDLVVGTGDMAVPRKFYTVNYTGWLTNGTKFDSSVDRNQPFTFPYGAKRVITGWDTGFEGMRVGGKRRLIVPYELAYGEMGSGPIPAKSTLIFDVELLGMSDTPPAPPAPPTAPAEQPGTPPAAGQPQSVTPKNPGVAPGAGTPGTIPPPIPGGTPSSPAKPAPATAPGNPGQPDPAKLPGGPPSA